MRIVLYLSFSLVSLCMLSCSAQTPKISTNIQNELFDSLQIQNFSLDYIMGKFDPASHPDFTTIPSIYRDNEVRYIRKDVLEAFIKMSDAASLDGIKIIIKSATRNFDNQKRIWENKWTGKTILEDGTNAAIDIDNENERALKILLYSSMPGTSRHHWGTDLDFNSFNNDWFVKGAGLKLYTWLQKHAPEYGFCQPYSKLGSDRSTGYLEEKWHWTYVPVADMITQQVSLSLSNDMISGFLGHKTAANIDVVSNYMLGISPACHMIK